MLLCCGSLGGILSLTLLYLYICQKKPEFYDDDIPLLLLGGAAPTQYLDPDDETLVGLYGLLQACGTPASDDSHGLKRSARPAMELTKSLIVDWKDGSSGSGSSSKDGPQNVIATAFLSLAVKHYAHMQLHVHCQGKDARAAAKEEACQLLVLLLSHHLTEDGEKPAPAMVDDVLHNPKAQQEFERTCASNQARATSGWTHPLDSLSHTY